MRKLIIFAFVGFFAQLIDGSLGMAFGLTSSSLLLAYGVAPAVASASIHMAEIATTAASGVSHYKFGNVDKKMVLTLVIPGSISAFFGAAFLSSLPGDLMKPFISGFLLLLGIYILFRFLLQKTEERSPSGNLNLKKRFLYPLGAIAGFFDAVGGGGWGPVNTPVLLSQKGATPRKVIGTVDTSEFAVTISATLGFVLFLGWEQFNWLWVAAFVIGGVIAAPIAAWLVRVMPAYILGVLVGGFIILTNTRTLLNTWSIDTNVIYLIYVILIIGWAAAIAHTVRNTTELKKAS
ncbi:sulfite exporter TauE/SafE family protein [Halobacillus trueperi]|uniref:Probable membrane transporter protein n=1 Tax=Halobacillus trueperi TaxID=156205 RepID=A0A3D8VDY4_9BACI|nr:sulfite exporter TauE/SafE family protein [Halobacillus trueperi]RDY67617.1 sulfite exporter TauE/SafE family protein [Halobacillus trueperi]